MSRLGIAVASAVVLASTSAYAASGIVGDIVTTPTGSRASDDAGPFNPLNLPSPGPLQGVGKGDGFTHYQTEVNVGATAISFKSATATSGSASSTFSSTTVGFNFHNEGGPVNFESTITAAGMGFQVVNRLNCTSFDQCSPISPGAGSFQDFATGYSADVIGQVGFDFNIADNGATIYSVKGSANLISYNGGYGYLSSSFLYNYVSLDGSSLYGTGSADQKLNGFRTLGNDTTSAGFAWDDTAVHLSLGTGDHFITYTTSAYSHVSAYCQPGGPLSEHCLVGYSGFGDPIGRGGAVESVDAFAGPASAIPGAANFFLPTYNIDTNTLTFQPGSATPEPAAWAMMIMGFGSIGAVLRRRRMVVARA